MKGSSLLILLGSAAVCKAGSNSFPSVSEFPSCSISCFTSILESDGCTESDFDCHCSLPSLYQNISSCVDKACDTADANTFLDGFISSCNELGYPLKGAPTTLLLPTATASTATSASATATSASKGDAAALVPTQAAGIVGGLLGVFALIYLM